MRTTFLLFLLMVLTASGGCCAWCGTDRFVCPATGCATAPLVEGVPTAQTPAGISR